MRLLKLTILHKNSETVGYNKRLSLADTSILIMTQRKSKKHQFRPAMDEASNPIHDEHVRKMREQEKS